MGAERQGTHGTPRRSVRETYIGKEAAVHSPEHVPVLLLQPPDLMESSTRVQVTRAGVSFGSTLAIAISWSVNHSILWAIVHGILSWIYVVYFALTR